MRAGFPIVGKGQSVGLFGGSFDPAHGGHVQVTLEALKRFGLDHVWWLVSPGNPIKSRGPADLGVRLERARALMDHPRVQITAIEAELGTTITADTLARLRAIYPDARFVWIMGADNLANLHRWFRWREVMQSVPLGVLARPGSVLSAPLSRAAFLYRRNRVAAQDAPSLPLRPAPAWCYLPMPLRHESSTDLRQNGAWQGPARA